MPASVAIAAHILPLDGLSTLESQTAYRRLRLFQRYLTNQSQWAQQCLMCPGRVNHLLLEMAADPVEFRYPLNKKHSILSNLPP